MYVGVLHYVVEAPQVNLLSKVLVLINQYDVYVRRTYLCFITQVLAAVLLWYVAKWHICKIFESFHEQVWFLFLHCRFGERMSDVKKENEKRTTRYLDKTGGNGLVSGNSHNKNNFVSHRKHLLVNKSNSSSNFSLNQQRANDFNSHRYSHTTSAASAASAMQSVSSRGGIPGHPMMDRSAAKQKRTQTNSEIMKRPLR